MSRSWFLQVFFSIAALVLSCGCLAVYTSQKNALHSSRKTISLVPKTNTDVDLKSNSQKNVNDLEDIRQWLGISVQKSKVLTSYCKNQENSKLDTPAKIPCVQKDIDFNPLFPTLDDKIQDELKRNFIDGTPYLRSIINTAVNLLCSRVEEYTLNTILKVGTFETKREIRSKFINMEEKTDTETIKTQVLIHANLIANKICSEVRYAFFQAGERACQRDLTKLLSFLASCIDEQSKGLVLKIAEDMMVQRLKEWASVQLGPDFFMRLILREVERCARPNSKPVGLFPNDFSHKMELSESDVDLTDGCTDLLQLSDIMDRALSCGVWYINALTPGPRPDENFMLSLIQDLISCIDKRMVTIDFAFYVMANFLMHLIIQYIMDAPWNWSEACIEGFVKLCHLCEDRKLEDDHLRIHLADTIRKTKNVKIKVANLVSVYSLQWLSKSLVLDHSLMVYCMTLTRLVEAELMAVETLFYKLMTARTNHHLVDASREMIDRVTYRVLTRLYMSACDCKTCTPSRVLSLVAQLRTKLEEFGSCELLQDLNAAFNN